MQQLRLPEFQEEPDLQGMQEGTAPVGSGGKHLAAARGAEDGQFVCAEQGLSLWQWSFRGLRLGGAGREPWERGLWWDGEWSQLLEPSSVATEDSEETAERAGGTCSRQAGVGKAKATVGAAAIRGRSSSPTFVGKHVLSGSKSRGRSAQARDHCGRGACGVHRALDRLLPHPDLSEEALQDIWFRLKTAAKVRARTLGRRARR